MDSNEDAARLTVRPYKPMTETVGECFPCIPSSPLLSRRPHILTQSKMTESPSKSLRVLISGAGIAGPILAYWLGKGGADVTVVERAREIRKEGQTVDIRHEALQIIKAMGVEQSVRQYLTKEKGLNFVNSRGGVVGRFPEDGSASFTAEIEIVRGQLANLLYEHSKDKAHYIFGDSINSFEERAEDILITFASGKSDKYDILIAAEGLHSRTRVTAFQQDIRAPLRPLHQWVAYFSLPRENSDDDWSQWFVAGDQRSVLFRPQEQGKMCACFMNYDPSGEQSGILSAKLSTEKQKEYFASLFSNKEWDKKERLVKALWDAEDFYVQEIAQVKMHRWSTGRVVCVGDTAFCPTPITGLGTSAGIVGSYVLSAALIQHGRDYAKAFQEYEGRLRPWIEQAQSLPPGAPALLFPKSALAVRIFHALIFVVALIVRSGLPQLIAKILPSFEKRIELPSFDLFERA